MVIDWIREDTNNTSGISNCWMCLISSFFLLSSWLVWKPSNSFSIKIGDDPMVGVVSFYRLSIDLLNFLHARGLFYLAQVGVKNGNIVVG